MKAVEACLRAETRALLESDAALDVCAAAAAADVAAAGASVQDALSQLWDPALSPCAKDATGVYPVTSLGRAPAPARHRAAKKPSRPPAWSTR